MLDIMITRSSREDEFKAVFAALRRLGYPIRLYVASHLSHVKSAASMDAVLIGGGQDITPRLYGQKQTWAYGCNLERDKLEIALAQRAFGQVPLLGVCRGMQVMAVAAGGELVQDIEQDLGVTHGPYHQLDWAYDYPMPDGLVNSYHHQAVLSVPKPYRQVGWGPGGVIEAIQGPKAFGVQFHPESLALHDARWLRFFIWWLEGFGRWPQLEISNMRIRADGMLLSKELPKLKNGGGKTDTKPRRRVGK